MSSDSVIIIDAGGRTFKTSTTTLEASGAGYFEALLGETGRKLRGKKRARVSADGDDAPGGQREIFLDRDPDVFADVLRFMRANRLPAAAAADAHRLEDLRTEAEFLCYEALVAACDEALEALERARPTARFLTFKIENKRNIDDDESGLYVSIDVPKGQVFFVVSAEPYAGQRRENTYILGAANRLEDHPAFVVRGRVSNEEYERQRPGAGFTFSGGATEKVHLCADGADFWVVAWVGHPSKIPGLGAPRD
ncbi:unnamed protein product [Pelagomonas calceolata]|uniref:BTB domain-containing protein n=1 Tax=Pelagomonas calceolata TaxID=35677 RepID=A0A8J2SMA9_9STRA|nr:unnamed protein product [Pelagomonas calceolata]